MRFSKYFIPTQKENSSDAKIKSHILMIKSGMIKQEASGIYSWLPVGFRILQKIIKVIEKFHELECPVKMVSQYEITSIDQMNDYYKSVIRVVNLRDDFILLCC